MKRTLYLLLSVIILGCLAGSCRFDSAVIAGDRDTLNLYGVDPMTLDPAVSGEMTSHGYILQLYNGLVRLNENLEPAPAIAEKWQISDGGTTYTFHLRRDVEFHDGRQVTAADFKYSWERACNPATGSSTAGTYLSDIVGVQEVLSGVSTEISGISVIDDFTLKVTIEAPKSYFLFKLTYPVAVVVDKDNVKSGKEWWRNPNGTGPFKLKKWEEENLLILERNDNYYGDEVGLKQVVYGLWSGVPMNLYETGEIDVTNVTINYIDKVTDTAGPFHRELKVTPELSFFYVGFNATKPPFDDVNVRRAFTQAIDKEKLISLVFREMVEPAYGILPPGIPGFNADMDGFSFDIEQAKAAIAASSYGSLSNLPPITFTASGYGGLISSWMEAVIEEWRRNLGVEVSVRQLEPQHYIYNLKEEKDQMFYMGWIADYPHPQDFLEVLFATGTQYNYGEYSNPEMDALLAKAALEQDYEKSISIYRQVEQILVDDAVCIPMWFGQNYILVKPDVEGYELTPMGFSWLEKVSIKAD